MTAPDSFDSPDGRTYSAEAPAPGRPWQPGDRVQVHLPIRPTGHWSWVSGTVRGTDEPGLPLGVRVDLDYAVNGGTDCYATHAELRAKDGDL